MDILANPIQSNQDTAYYEAQLTLCDSELQTAIRNEQRFEVMLKVLTEKQQELETACILAWDDSEQFKALTAEYERHTLLFTLAPKAHRHWQLRAHNLRHYKIELNRQRDNAVRIERDAAAEAQRIQERQAQQAAWLAETRARQAQQQADKEREQAPIQERIEAQQQQQQADSNAAMQWLKKVTGAK